MIWVAASPALSYSSLPYRHFLQSFTLRIRLRSFVFSLTGVKRQYCWPSGTQGSTCDLVVKSFTSLSSSCSGSTFNLNFRTCTSNWRNTSDVIFLHTSRTRFTLAMPKPPQLHFWPSTTESVTVWPQTYPLRRAFHCSFNVRSKSCLKSSLGFRPMISQTSVFLSHTKARFSVSIVVYSGLWLWSWLFTA